MRKKPHESHTLVEPQQALRVYLDALLGETTLVAEEGTPAMPVVDAVLAQSLIQATESTADQGPMPAPETVPAPASPTQSQARIEPPAWAQGSFQCLSFQVAGVTLAAPLEKLNGIVELKEEITELPGYAPWVIGLLPNRGQNVQVVDVAKIIMPDEGQNTVPVTERMRFILLLDDGRFGLATDNISRVLTLEPDSVRWRGEHSKRPWLAGTVIEQMCALLDMDLLRAQLQAGMKDA
ncbi:MAG TPA: chemotaxis protein CheW [Gammaproteobacteria bacterium]|nr:chemotaxis protein CheW [Gammaproteobacteria bacterium]